MNVKPLLKQHVREYLFFQRLLLVMGLLLLSAFGAQAQTVTTDKDDYAPGEYVIITGSGWEPGERVDFHFEETPKPSTCYNSHDIYSVADSEGKIYNNQFLVKSNHIGVAFELIATGSSGSSATTYFTDANVEFSATGLPSPLTPTPTIKVNYKVTRNSDGVEVIKPTSTTFAYGQIATAIPVRIDETITYTFDNVTLSDGKTYSAPGGATRGDNNGQGKQSIVANYNLALKTNPNISWTAPSKIVYGTELSATQLNATADVAGTFVYSPAAGTKLAAGQHDLRVDFTPTDAANYKTATKTVSITVGKAALTVTTADKSKVYGETFTAFTGDVTGEVAGDEFSIASYASAGAAADATVAGGPYQITATLTANDRLANYNVTETFGKLSVGKAALTVTTADKSKVYGETFTAFTGDVTGEVAGDEFSIASYASAGAAADATVAGGPYQITATLTANDRLANYNVTETFGKLSVGKATLTVTAANASRLCGQTNATFTGQIVGIKNNEAITASYTSVATSMSGAGVYDIVPAVNGTEAVLKNYNIILNKGTLTIEQVTVDASANATPQAIKSTATFVTAKLINGTGVAANVPVKLYFNGSTTPMLGVSDASGTVNINVGVLATGVYKIVIEAGTGCSESIAYLPVYDPNGGFVTGGGWIISPEKAIRTSAYGLAGVDATGKANFGFVAKYKNGKSTLAEVDGNTEFQFNAGKLNFKSTSHEAMSLVVTSEKATYKGVGTLNGYAGFKFTVIAIDGDVKGRLNNDKFRIRIWDASNALVYDNLVGSNSSEEYNEPTDYIGGGSIVIHDGKLNGGSSSKALVSDPKLQLEKQLNRFYNYPNPYTDKTTIAFTSLKEESFALEVYDVKGALVKKIETGVTEVGKLYEFEFDGRNHPEGMYFARLITNSGVQTIKMVLKR
ncbi:putative secreted protein (Por secretion system target) [Pontibacter ummariensis]|uniref:Por secretion system C-terminal sorting domain-containing protein n=1 Tax=Pontibacter ummariensis TaxID=1610492 RepID=A0A239BX33_9BACT|nr:MBG domain-containing protein [Pontibacter ummariensis]PRY15564.1 putative secreted protein (Por secretion system target) [Pontibacter ummariensis]SNS12567.1 Por secretion system C-terminal sorting domain-containing protein [Pontibacter ummariensis]